MGFKKENIYQYIDLKGSIETSVSHIFLFFNEIIKVSKTTNILKTCLQTTDRQSVKYRDCHIPQT